MIKLSNMCYSLSIFSGTAVFEEETDATFQKELEKMFYIGAYDHPQIPVITNEQPDMISQLTWGLIPFWTKTEDQALNLRDRTANARAETLFEKPAFRHAAGTLLPLQPAHRSGRF